MWCGKYNGYNSTYEDSHQDNRKNQTIRHFYLHSLYPIEYLYFFFQRRSVIVLPSSFTMNASDILQKKQNTTLYKAYYQPTVFQSTILTTIRPVSSIILAVSNGVPVRNTSYASCTQTVYQTVCEPTFMTYQTRHALQDGTADCTGRTPKETKWTANQSTILYSYSTIYSSLVNPSTLAPSTIRISSTIVQTAPMPLICPLIKLRQGTSFASQCPSCSHVLGSPGACCPSCAE
jgi:hypothetical protein